MLLVLVGELKFDLKKINWKDVVVSAILFYVVYFVLKSSFPIKDVPCNDLVSLGGVGVIDRCLGFEFEYPFSHYYLVIYSISFLFSFLYYFFFNKKNSSLSDLVISFLSILITAFVIIPLLLFLISKFISLYYFY